MRNLGKSKQFLIFLGCLLAMLLAVIAFAPTSYLDRLVKNEQSCIVSNLGYDSALSIHDEAKKLYQESMIDSGAYKRIHEFFIPSKEQRQASKGFKDFGLTIFKSIESKLDAAMRLAYVFCLRIVVFSMNIPIALYALIPAILQGFLMRQAMKTNFAYSSPIRHRYALTGVFLFCCLLLAMFVLPIAVFPLVFFVITMAIGHCVGISVAYTQKRI